MVGEELKKSYPSRARVSETIGYIFFPSYFFIYLLNCFFFCCLRFLYDLVLLLLFPSPGTVMTG